MDKTHVYPFHNHFFLFFDSQSYLRSTEKYFSILDSIVYLISTTVDAPIRELIAIPYTVYVRIIAIEH